MLLMLLLVYFKFMKKIEDNFYLMLLLFLTFLILMDLMNNPLPFFVLINYNKNYYFILKIYQFFLLSMI